jgi:HEAT repeat protein
MKKRFTNPFVDDHRSVKSLFQVAISEFENQKAWNAIHSLRRRGTREVFNSAKKLCASPVAKEREVGVNVLAQIGSGKPVFLRQSVDLLIARLHDRSVHIVSAAGVGLGHRDDPRAIPHLIALRNHPSSRVRFGVAFGLARQKTAGAIATLVELSRDKDRDVRDYATFGLAELNSLNTKAIRDALVARLGERDVEIRGQALIGLAQRKDPRVLKPLQKELKRRFRGGWCLEAAELACNPSIYPLLIKMRRHWKFPDGHWFTTSLDEAIVAWKPPRKRKTKR